MQSLLTSKQTCGSAVASQRQSKRGPASKLVAKATPAQHHAQREQCSSVDRRILMTGMLTGALAASTIVAQPAQAALPYEKPKELCDEECSKKIEQLELVTLPSGLQYRDIEEGQGAVPPVGFQVVCDYVAYTKDMRVFDSSLEKGKPYDIRVGAGQVIPGLDEGLRTMRTGGFRRLYIPGELAFPQPLKAAAGRPSVPARSPLVFDVKLLYVPGADEE